MPDSIVAERLSVASGPALCRDRDSDMTKQRCNRTSEVHADSADDCPMPRSTRIAQSAAVRHSEWAADDMFESRVKIWTAEGAFVSHNTNERSVSASVSPSNPMRRMILM